MALRHWEVVWLLSCHCLDLFAFYWDSASQTLRLQRIPIYPSLKPVQTAKLQIRIPRYEAAITVLLVSSQRTKFLHISRDKWKLVTNWCYDLCSMIDVEFFNTLGRRRKRQPYAYMYYNFLSNLESFLLFQKKRDTCNFSHKSHAIIQSSL